MHVPQVLIAHQGSDLVALRESLFERPVAGEQLVRPLPAQHHSEAVPMDAPAQQPGAQTVADGVVVEGLGQADDPADPGRRIGLA